MPPAESTVPVLFLPGTLCDARVFAAISGALSAERTLHADLTQDTSVQDAAERLLASAPDRFIAVGFSLGAIVALELAARAPHRIAAMALIAGNARPVPEADHAARRAAVAGVDPATLVGEQLWSHYVHPSRADEKCLRALITAMANACPPGTAERQTEIALSRPDNRPRLPRMDMPTLVLSGAQDVVAPEELQAEMANALPCATWTKVANAGHFLLLEQPAACSAAFSAWLGQVDLHQSRAERPRADISTDPIASEVS